MKELIFSYDWNKKLGNKAFTTIRIKQEKKYIIGEDYKIILQPKNKIPDVKGIASIVDIKYFKLDKLNNFISYIDTGYSISECTQIIKRMYTGTNFTNTDLSLILLKYK